MQPPATSTPASAAQPTLASAYHTASAAARPTNAAVFTPQDLTMWGMTLKVMREEGGVRALYRGLVPTAMGVAPYVGEHARPNGITASSHGVNSPRHQLRRVRSTERHHHTPGKNRRASEASLWCAGGLRFSDPDVPVRRAASEDASDGTECAWVQVQRRV